MGYSLPKGTLIMKLPRVYPLMLKITTLAAIMLCCIYISSICLKQASINMMTAELARENPLKQSSYDRPVERPMEEHSNDPRTLSMKQSVTNTKPELVRSKPMEDHSFDSEIVDLNQMGTQVNLDMWGTGPGDRIITFRQRKIQMKPEKMTINPTGHSYNTRAVSLKQTKMLVNSELEQTKLRDKQSFGPRIAGEEQTIVEQKPESVRTEPDQVHCQNPRIPQSEIPYVHYPVPKNYSRGSCACTPVRSFVIVSMQRSGSRWLESLLDSHDNISSNGEIFIYKERRTNVSAIMQTLDMVYNLDFRQTASKKRCTAAVGFKWMLNQGLLKNHEVVSKYFKQRGVSVIFLFRRNLLRQLVSHTANARDHSLFNGTHKAHVSTQQEANVLASYKPKLNAKLLVSNLKLAARKAVAAKERFKSIRHIDLYYEDLVHNNTQKLTEVMNFLRVPQQRLSSGHVKIHTKPLPEMISNWDAVHRALKRSQFASFLTSD